VKNNGKRLSAWSHARHDIVEWDVPNWSVALDYWQEHTACDLPSIHALEIGSRRGGLSLWLALCGAHVLCTDIDGPSEIAAEKHFEYGVSRQVEYADLDALDIPYAEAFDVVLFKSVLGGIGRGNRKDRQCRAVAEMYRALKPGGELWFAENLVAHHARPQRGGLHPAQPGRRPGPGSTLAPWISDYFGKISSN